MLTMFCFHMLKGFFVSFGAVAVPHSHAVCLEALCGASVKADKHIYGRLTFLSLLRK